MNMARRGRTVRYVSSPRRRFYGGYGKYKRSHKKGTINVPIGGIAIGIATAYQLGAGEAVQRVMAGDFQGGIQRLGENSVQDVLVASIPPLVYGIAKKAMGPVQLFRVGKFRFTI